MAHERHFRTHEEDAFYYLCVAVPALLASFAYALIGLHDLSRRFLNEPAAAITATSIALIHASAFLMSTLLLRG